jgi:TNF receptor-associated factor 4
MSVGITVLKGKYDGLLKWPFVGNVSLTILNQLQDEDHLNVIISFSDLHAGESKGCFGISHAALSYDPDEGTQYLKDDTLYFRISVDMDDHKPWLECIVK